MTLVVGATGFVGGEICRLLASQGMPCRGLVRTTSSPEKVERLRSQGVEIVQGDLKDRASLDAACRGVDAVVSTASATVTRQQGDSLDSVDRQGQLDLIEAAVRAGVRRFVLVSFVPAALEFPLQDAKKAVEDRLKRSGMTYTILQPTCFVEVWLSPALGFDVANGRAQIYGAGTNRISWISGFDVASFAVAALATREAENAVVKLGGPDALSPLEVVALAEQTTGGGIEVQHVPEAALRAQYESAGDPLQKSFAGLMLYYAGGCEIDMAQTAPRFGVPRLRSVADHLRGQAAPA